MSGLAATLRQAERGTSVHLLMRDGSVVSGELRGVNGESIDLDGKRIELRRVQRVRLDLSSSPGAKAAKRAA